jgi:outer membrane lipoprotein carrier protein
MTPLVGNKWRWWTVALLCLWLLIGLAREAKADGLLGNIESIKGSFTQEIINASGSLTAQSSGEFALLRPHFFKWQITSPGKQLLLSDGEFFWQHDEDLETVVRRPLQSQLNSPLGVLLADEEVLREHYSVKRNPNYLQLVPLDPNAMFTSMQVTIDQGVPTAVIVTDNLDQRINFRLSPAKSGELTAADFVFMPPAEADITIVKP